MAKFSYIAVDNKGNTNKGTVEQSDRANAINAIIKQGLRPISVNETKQKDNTTAKKIFGSKKVKTDVLVMFTRQLSAMVGAGVPLLRALNSLATNTSKKDYVLRDILNGVVRDIEAGVTLGDSLAKYPNTFDEVYVNMVRAGEAAGILDEILKRLATQQEKTMSMRKKIKSSMAYPVVLLCITTIAFFGLMIFIVPKIGDITKEMGGENATLPAITLIMLAVSSFMVQFWYVIVLVVGGIIYGISIYIKTPHGRFTFHKILLKLPLIRNVVKKIAIAHFARTYAALTEAGVAVLESLRVTSRAIGNAVYEQALLDAETEVKNGKTLSSVIAANPLFPPIVSQMLAVGEETGQTDKVIIKVADFYEEEVDASISSISSIIEPVMIVIMGSMVGLIAASVMLPIAQLSTTVQ
ncbi:type II secretion system F family protein [bacterium]|nr:type II secretion system F family protein [bacterium]